MTWKWKRSCRIKIKVFEIIRRRNLLKKSENRCKPEAANQSRGNFEPERWNSLGEPQHGRSLSSSFWQVKLYQHKHAQMKTNTSRLANYTHVGHTVHRFWPDFWMTRLYLQSAPGAKGFDSINTAPFFKLIIPRVKLQMAPATPGWYLSGHVARYPRQILRR